MTRVVVFVFYDDKRDAVLSERRPKDHSTFPNMLTFPTGKAEVHETLREALLREAKEEFGITPTEFFPLGSLKGAGENILHPFWIKSWDGTLSDMVLDKGNDLIWELCKEAITSFITTRKIIIQRLKEHLNS